MMIAFTSCEPIEKPQEENPNENTTPIEQELKFPEKLYGDWHCKPISLSSTEIYVTFTPENLFTLYQKIQQGGFKVFNGTYGLTETEDGASYILRGEYNDGTPWGADYIIESSDKDSLTMTAGETTETYTRVEGGIPEEVRNNAEIVIKSIYEDNLRFF